MDPRNFPQFVTSALKNIAWYGKGRNFHSLSFHISLLIPIECPLKIQQNKWTFAVHRYDVYSWLSHHMTHILRYLTVAWILQFHSVWKLGTWEVRKWQLKNNNNVVVKLVNRDHINCRTAIYSCLIMLILFVTEVSFACGFIINDLTRSQRVTKYSALCVFVFVCVLKTLNFSWTKFWNDLLECCRLYQTY